MPIDDSLLKFGSYEVTDNAFITSVLNRSQDVDNNIFDINNDISCCSNFLQVTL